MPATRAAEDTRGCLSTIACFKYLSMFINIEVSVMVQSTRIELARYRSFAEFMSCKRSTLRASLHWTLQTHRTTHEAGSRSRKMEPQRAHLPLHNPVQSIHTLNSPHIPNPSVPTRSNTATAHSLIPHLTAKPLSSRVFHLCECRCDNDDAVRVRLELLDNEVHQPEG